MGLRCGVGTSLRALRGKSGVIGALLASHGPEDLLAELGCHLATPELIANTDFHFFAFGGAGATAHWMAGLRPGAAVRPAAGGSD